MSKQRVAAALLTLSAAGFGLWRTHEGFTAAPVIPTRGDVPTIGHGSTRYEDGTPVKLTDPPITRKRAEELARNLNRQAEQAFVATIPGVKLTQGEFDLYMDFVGNFGLKNWKESSMRRLLMAGQFRQACDALLMWRRQGGRDCSLPENAGPQGCRGVWTRQQDRHARCVAEQS